MLSRNPNVAFAIYDQNNPYDMVSVGSKVVEQVNGDASEKYIDKLTKKYMGLDKYPSRLKDYKFRPKDPVRNPQETYDTFF